MIVSTNGELNRLLTRLRLRQLAGAKSFELGAEYFAAGQVTRLSVHNGRLTATVQGTDSYRVALGADGSALEHECTCPMGAEGAFCRHCVAVGLAWLANGTHEPRPRKRPAPKLSLEDTRAWLAQQDKSKLVDMILARAASDPRLREQLLAEAKAEGRR